MSSRVLIAGALLCAALTSGCASQASRPFAADRAAVKSTDVIASVRQADLYAQINQSNIAAAAGGGLLLALIDAGVNSSRANDAEGEVRPLRDALIGFDFDATLKQDLERELASVGWLAASGVTVNKDVTDARHDAILKQSAAGGVLFVATDYSLSPNFSKLKVSAMVSLFPRGDEFHAAAGKVGVRPAQKKGSVRTRLQHAAYYNTLAVETALPQAGAEMAPDRDANRDAWGANQGEKLRSALTRSTQLLAQTLAKDLEYVVPPKDAAPQGELHQEGIFRGRVWQQGPEGKLVRFNDGTLKYYAVIDVPTPATAATAAAAPAAPGAPAAEPAAAQ